MPHIYLKTKKSIIINAKNNFHIIGDYICNFKLNEFQELYLIKKQDIIDKLEVPIMSKYETYGRYNNSNYYVFFNNYDNIRRDI